MAPTFLAHTCPPPTDECNMSVQSRHASCGNQKQLTLMNVSRPADEDRHAYAATASALTHVADLPLGSFFSAGLHPWLTLLVSSKLPPRAECVQSQDAKVHHTTAVQVQQTVRHPAHNPTPRSHGKASCCWPQGPLAYAAHGVTDGLLLVIRRPATGTPQHLPAVDC